MRTILVGVLLQSFLFAQASRPANAAAESRSPIAAEIARLSIAETEPKMPTLDPDSTREERAAKRAAHFEAFAAWSKREEERKAKLAELKVSHAEAALRKKKDDEAAAAAATAAAVARAELEAKGRKIREAAKSEAERVEKCAVFFNAHGNRRIDYPDNARSEHDGGPVWPHAFGTLAEAKEFHGYIVRGEGLSQRCMDFFLAWKARNPDDSHVLFQNDEYEVIDIDGDWCKIRTVSRRGRYADRERWVNTQALLHHSVTMQPTTATMAKAEADERRKSEEAVEQAARAKPPKPPEITPSEESLLTVESFTVAAPEPCRLANPFGLPGSFVTDDYVLKLNNRTGHQVRLERGYKIEFLDARGRVVEDDVSGTLDVPVGPYTFTNKALVDAKVVPVIVKAQVRRQL